MLPPVPPVLVVRLLDAAEIDVVGLAAPELQVVILLLLVFLNTVLIVGIVEVVDRPFARGNGGLPCYACIRRRGPGGVRAI